MDALKTATYVTRCYTLAKGVLHELLPGSIAPLDSKDTMPLESVKTLAKTVYLENELLLQAECPGEAPSDV